MTARKGIILAGGTGTRLYPTTLSLSKQLLPIYDKPMIYYPLAVLMQAGLRDILIITTPQDQSQFQGTLGDGSQWGVRLSYAIQPEPEGLAQALIIAEDYLAGAPSVLILGDNLFFGDALPSLLAEAAAHTAGATLFAYRVAHPERYGVLDYDSAGAVRAIIEKPLKPPSEDAVTGLYFFDHNASARARTLTPSARGELEITDLLETYLHEGTLSVQHMAQGDTWLDTGTPGSLLDAGNFVRTLIEGEGRQTGSPDEIAFDNSWISSEQLVRNADNIGDNAYARYLRSLVHGSG